MSKSSSGFKVCGDVVVIIPCEMSEATASGILIPSSMLKEAREKANMGRVIAVGPDVKQVKVNEVWMFDKHESRPYEIPAGGHDEELKPVLVFVMREDSLFAGLTQSQCVQRGINYPTVKGILDLVQST